MSLILLKCMQKMKALALTISLIKCHQGVWTLSLQYYYLSDSNCDILVSALRVYDLYTVTTCSDS